MGIIVQMEASSCSSISAHVFPAFAPEKGVAVRKRAHNNASGSSSLVMQQPNTLLARLSLPSTHSRAPPPPPPSQVSCCFRAPTSGLTELEVLWKVESGGELKWGQTCSLQLQRGGGGGSCAAGGSPSSSSTLGCRNLSFENLEGYWCRDRRRSVANLGLQQHYGLLPSSSSSTSCSWDLEKKNKKRIPRFQCRGSSQELNKGGGGGGGGGGGDGDKTEEGTEGDGYELAGGEAKEGRKEKKTPVSSSGAAGPANAFDLANSGSRLNREAAAELGSLESELFLYTGRMRALKSFEEEVSKPDEEINLVRAAVFVAQHLYPRVTADEVEAELDQMAADLERSLPPHGERYTMRMIKSINKYLYGELGFRGADVYLNPDNSCLNMVLERRQGLPLTMSLVYMELAKRVGLPVQGVNLPAHFMCRPCGEGLEFFIDAHAGGKVTFLQDAEDRLSLVYGVPVAISPAFLQHTAISNQAFLIRLLFNLKRIYFERKDPVSTLCIIDYLKLVRPGVIEETRDYGVCLYLLKRFSDAIPCLESYLQEAPRATDAESIRSLLFKMRRDL